MSIDGVWYDLLCPLVSFVPTPIQYDMNNRLKRGHVSLDILWPKNSSGDRGKAATERWNIVEGSSCEAAGEIKVWEHNFGKISIMEADIT